MDEGTGYFGYAADRAGQRGEGIDPGGSSFWTAAQGPGCGARMPRLAPADQMINPAAARAELGRCSVFSIQCSVISGAGRRWNWSLRSQCGCGIVLGMEIG